MSVSGNKDGRFAALSSWLMVTSNSLLELELVKVDAILCHNVPCQFVLISASSLISGLVFACQLVWQQYLFCTHLSTTQLLAFGVGSLLAVLLFAGGWFVFCCLDPPSVT